MPARFTRRQLLAAGATAGVVGATGCTTLADGLSGGFFSPPVDVRGAIYMPTRAFNTHQMWGNYDPAVIERDMGYAAELDLNAIRTILGYEFWKEDPAAHERRLDHFLDAADEHGLRVLLGLFESVGREPTDENLHNTDPLTATAVQTPATSVIKDASKWWKPRAFVQWVAERYRDDERLLALEVMNEPGWREERRRFAGAMFEELREHSGRVPLTVGSTSLANCARYMDWNVDILQFHYNFASSPDIYRNLLAEANAIAKRSGKRVWLTEWQRVRTGGSFNAAVTGGEWKPNYSTLAPVIREAGVGNFFWSLMIKPAYVLSQRKRGVISGVFHEDGAVWSLDDARAVKAMSGDRSYDGRERKQWPAWCREVKEEYLLDEDEDEDEDEG